MNLACLSWFRAGVEHCIAQLKKFAIVGGRFRGRLDADGGKFLHAVLSVICGLVVLQVRASPLRTHIPLLGPEELEVVEEKAAELGVQREVIAGHPIGSHRDIFLGEDGSIRGPGPEPSSAHIDSRCRSRDFRKGLFDTRCCCCALWLTCVCLSHRPASPRVVVELVLEGHRSLRQQTHRHTTDPLGVERPGHVRLPHPSGLSDCVVVIVNDNSQCQ